jgi:hypothetical protein
MDYLRFLNIGPAGGFQISRRHPLAPDHSDFEMLDNLACDSHYRPIVRDDSDIAA